MKKLGVLVMAMFLVVGMTMGAMALNAEPTNESRGNNNDYSDYNNETDDQEIPIKLDVEPIALVKGIGNQEFDLGKITAVNRGSENNETGLVKAQIISNTGVNVTVENNFNPEAVGLKNHHLWGSGNDRWVISPNVIVWNDKIEQQTASKSTSFNVSQGKTDLNMKMVMNYNQNNPAWTKLEPTDGAIDAGEVTITISAK